MSLATIIGGRFGGVKLWDRAHGARWPAPRPAVYSAAMQIILPILVVIAMFATLGTLLVGVFWMARGGDPKRANAIMRYRIWFQGTALLLFFIFMMLYRR